MIQYEYKVVPAPNRGVKARGVKGPEARFACALEQVMNDMGREGWEYVRAETLPSEERKGLTSTSIAYRNVLVFRRQRADDLSSFQPRLLERPADPVPLPAAALEQAPPPRQPKPAPLVLTPVADPPESSEPEEDVAAPVQHVPSILQRRAAKLNLLKGDVAAE